VAERLGQLDLARSDYLWLATSAETPDADERYERLAGTRLTKSERLQRAESFAERGLVSEVKRELALLRKAPGSSPAAAEIVRTQAWAHYRSRADYATAAKQYEQAARLAGAAWTI
jgi:hypothetical protein